MTTTDVKVTNPKTIRLMTNARCALCAEAHESLNGRYCRRLRRYVEHREAPLCGVAAEDSDLILI